MELQSLELTPKQRRFCEEYVIDWNGTRAATAAGYSKKSAHVLAFETLTNPKVQAYIKEVQADLAKLCNISAAMVIMELKKVAFSSAASMRVDWADLKSWDQLSEADKAILSEVEVTEKLLRNQGNDDVVMLERKVKVKTYDKLAAMRQLSRMLGFDAPIKIDQTQRQSPNTREELEKELAEIKSRRGKHQ